MASTIRRIALKSLVFGLTLITFEITWTCWRSRPPSGWRHEGGTREAAQIPDALSLREKRQQFLASRSAPESRDGHFVRTENLRRATSRPNQHFPTSDAKEKVIFQKDNVSYINLDQDVWTNSELTASSLRENVSRLLATPNAELRVMCTDSLRHATVERRVSALDGGSYVISDVDHDVGRHVVLSIGADLSDRQTGSNVFYAPLTSLRWIQMNYGVILIVADTLTNWLLAPVTRHVLCHLCQVGAVVFFLPTTMQNAALVGQASKLFIAPLLAEYEEAASGFREAGAIRNQYVVLADADLWPLGRPEFNFSRTITSLNSGCCQWFEHDGRRLKSWPLAYLGMRVAAWWQLLDTEPTDLRQVKATSYGMMAVFRRHFGEAVGRNASRTRAEAAYLPSFLLSLWLNEYVMAAGTAEVTFAPRPGPRLEPKEWFASGAVPDPGRYFDFRLPKIARSGHQNDAWSVVSQILAAMYGPGDPKLGWCQEYHETYVRLTRQRRQTFDKNNGSGSPGVRRQAAFTDGQNRRPSPPGSVGADGSIQKSSRPDAHSSLPDSDPETPNDGNEILHRQSPAANQADGASERHTPFAFRISVEQRQDHTKSTKPLGEIKDHP